MLIAGLIIFQVLIFLGLILVLRRVMTRNIASATRHIDEINQEYTKKEEEASRHLEEARRQSEEMMGKAKAEAETLKAQSIKDAETERDKMVNQARTQSQEIIQQAERSREQILAEINSRVEKESINKAAFLIHKILPEHFKREVHSRWLDELIKDGFNRLENLRIPNDVDEARVTSAFALHEDERKAIMKKLKDILKREMKIKEEVDPEVVAGLIITVGSLVLDGSLKNKIREEAQGSGAGAS